MCIFILVLYSERDYIVSFTWHIWEKIYCIYTWTIVLQVLSTLILWSNVSFFVQLHHLMAFNFLKVMFEINQLIFILQRLRWNTFWSTWHLQNAFYWAWYRPCRLGFPSYIHTWVHHACPPMPTKHLCKSGLIFINLIVSYWLSGSHC